MKLEAGKFYRTRDGRKVEVLSIREDRAVGYYCDRSTISNSGTVTCGGFIFYDLFNGSFDMPEKKFHHSGSDPIAEWSDEPELLPCPFCGSQHTSVVNETTQCVDCSTSGPHAESREEAIAAWNKRDYDAARKAIDRVGEIVDKAFIKKEMVK